MRPPLPPPLPAATRAQPMRPGTAVAFGLAGILVALTVLFLNWYAAHAAPSPPQDPRTAAPTPSVQMAAPRGEARALRG